MTEDDIREDLEASGVTVGGEWTDEPACRLYLELNVSCADDPATWGYVCEIFGYVAKLGCPYGMTLLGCARRLMAKQPQGARVPEVFRHMYPLVREAGLLRHT